MHRIFCAPGKRHSLCCPSSSKPMQTSRWRVLEAFGLQPILQSSTERAPRFPCRQRGVPRAHSLRKRLSRGEGVLGLLLCRCGAILPQCHPHRRSAKFPNGRPKRHRKWRLGARKDARLFRWFPSIAEFSALKVFPSMQYVFLGMAILTVVAFIQYRRQNKR